MIFYLLPIVDVAVKLLFTVAYET